MKTLYTCSFAIILAAAITFNVAAQDKTPSSGNLALYKTIVHMDSVFFNAYNTCDMAKQTEIYADSIEFYHDRGGLMTSKQGILDATKKNICGKVTREVIPASIEVYPIKNFGAVEMGLHKFHNHVENSVSEGSKFIIIWRLKDNKWQITRVVSLH